MQKESEDSKQEQPQAQTSCTAVLHQEPPRATRTFLLTGRSFLHISKKKQKLTSFRVKRKKRAMSVWLELTSFPDEM